MSNTETKTSEIIEKGDNYIIIKNDYDDVHKMADIAREELGTNNIIEAENYWNYFPHNNCPENTRVFEIDDRGIIAENLDE